MKDTLILSKIAKLMLLDQYLNTLKQCFEKNKPLLPQLSINIKTCSHIAALQQNIQQLSNKQITHKVERINLSSATLESLVESYLRFVRDVNPWSLLDSIDLMIDTLHALSISLNTKNPRHLNLLLPVLYEYMGLLVPLAKLVDEESMTLKNWANDYPRLSFISNDLLKCLNNIKSDPEIALPSNRPKITVLFDICISLCNVYFSIGKNILCNNVFSNINVLRLDTKLISKGQLLKYRYILGKFHSQQANYTSAFYHLNWCYKNLPKSMSFTNHIKILKYLLPVGLLVGKVPNSNYLQNLIKSSVSDNNGAPGRFLLNSMLPLVTAYKKGDLQRVLLIIYKNELLWKRLGIWIGFVQRIRLLVIRNIIYRSFLIQGKKLKLADIQHALLLTFTGNDVNSEQLPEIYHSVKEGQIIEMDTVESVLANLVFNGLVKAKMTGLYTFVMSKDSPFPLVYDTYLRNHPLDRTETWMN